METARFCIFSRADRDGASMFDAPDDAYRASQTGKSVPLAAAA